MVLISIIVPIYRVPEIYLNTCIKSLITQTLPDIEIILIDDGSPDRCGIICDNYAEQDDRIKVLHTDNMGLAAARNAGCLAATGEYLMFVDGDDWIEHDMCEGMLLAGQHSDAELVMCSLVKAYGRSSNPYVFSLESGHIYENDECRWLQQQLLNYNANIATAYAKLIRRDFIIQHDIYHDTELKQGAEGLEFNLRLFEHLNRAIFINAHFYHYRYDENSILASHSESNHARVIGCFEKIKKFINTSQNRDALLPWFNNRLLYVVITTAISGYFSPMNNEPYRDKKHKYELYLEHPMIRDALLYPDEIGLDEQRRFVLLLIDKRLFRVLNVMGKLRKWQKKLK